MQVIYQKQKTFHLFKSGLIAIFSILLVFLVEVRSLEWYLIGLVIINSVEFVIRAVKEYSNKNIDSALSMLSIFFSTILLFLLNVPLMKLAAFFYLILLISDYVMHFLFRTKNNLSPLDFVYLAGITTELFLMLFGHRMDWFASFELSSLHYLIIEILAILVILVQLTLFFQATSKMAASEQKSFNLNEELGWLRNYFSLINHQIRSPLAATGMRFQMISKRNNAESPELIVKRNEFEDIQNAHNQVMDVADKFLSSWKYLDQNEVTSLSELANMKCEDFGLPRVKFESTRRLSKTESLSLNIAIDNFLDNALKYGGEEIRLSMPEENKLVIHDNGKGMSKEKLANIGSEYQPPSGSSSGTGMGMVLTRKVLDHMGWKYEIASNEHIGTRITLFKA